MKICHDHNLAQPLPETKTFGIRVSLAPGDSFGHLIDASWERLHWFASVEERDRVLADMRGEHLYSRRGDQPTTRFESIERNDT
jgi:hypothetical protein